jgi:formylglycine-generating enzyme required for sulfatase activity
MSNLFKLGKTRPPPAAGGAAPRLTLAAFGKHPGWDDHMPGIGVETETLAYLKQTLYVTGIGRQIDSGAWEKLEADKRQEGFDHTFLWQRAGHLVLGQLWSSKDGKGRSKYPMVLCVECDQLSPSLLLNKVRPGLEALRGACKAATAAEQVASNCRVAQEQLRMLFAGGAPQPDPSQPDEDPRRFLERAELGPDRLGLLRVLHELRGSFGIPGDTRTPGRGGGAPTPSLHFRVPMAADSQNAALLLWSGFLRSAISGDVPLVLMARGNADWLDVVVGEPKADDFFFLQASQKGFPLVTQIPYELSPNAMARLREVEVRFRGAEPTAPEAAAKAPPPAPPPTPKVPPPAQPPSDTTLTPAPPPTPKIAPPVPPPIAKVPPPVPPPAPKVAPSVPPTIAKAPPPAPPPAAKVPPPAPPSAAKVPPPAPPPAAVTPPPAPPPAAKVPPPAPPPAAVTPPPAPPATANVPPPAPPPAAIAPPPAQPPTPKAPPPGPPPTAKVAPPAPAPTPKAPPPAPAPVELGAEKPAPRSKRNAGLAAGGVVVLLVAAFLVWMPQSKTGEQKHFDELLANGKALLGEKKYDEAIHDFEDADKVHPQDDQVKQLLVQARGQRDSAALASSYQSTMKSGRESFAHGDFAAALAAAQKVLVLKPEDNDAKQLRDDAQAKLAAIAAATQKEADYQSEMKNGRASFASGDYATTLADVDKALALKPQDAAATQLGADAQAKQSALAQATQNEADYQTAMKNGRGSFARGDYTQALAEAAKALSLKPGDADAKHLGDETQTKMRALALAARQEADYQSALKNGRGLFARGDYTNALAEAGKALSFKPGDADAKQLRDDAQAQLASISAAMQKEADYQSAMKNGRGLFANGDYTNALAEAGKALSLKPGDADAQRLRDDANNKLSGLRPRLFTNTIQMEFVWVPGIGASGAFVGKYEVTERQYKTIMGDLPSGEAPADGNMPVVGVTFPQATKFCDELSKRENKHYSLPTRQQWLAAAGLSEDKVSNAWDLLSASGALDHQATSLNNPRRIKPVAVGTMGASTNGLCDMLGNVREWDSEEQRAGFSYQSRKGGRTEELFLPGSATDTWIEQETGLRCFLQENPPP